MSNAIFSLQRRVSFSFLLCWLHIECGKTGFVKFVDVAEIGGEEMMAIREQKVIEFRFDADAVHTVCKLVYFVILKLCQMIAFGVDQPPFSINLSRSDPIVEWTKLLEFHSRKDMILPFHIYSAPVYALFVTSKPFVIKSRCVIIHTRDDFTTFTVNQSVLMTSCIHSSIFAIKVHFILILARDYLVAINIDATPAIAILNIQKAIIKLIVYLDISICCSSSCLNLLGCFFRNHSIFSLASIHSWLTTSH